jgi:hypothetical protein
VQNIKKKLSDFAARHGLFHTRDMLLLVPKLLQWHINGSGETPPQPLKRFIISYYLNTFGCTEFVETGTHVGDTLAFVSRRKNISCTSIELDSNFYQRACNRFKRAKNIKLLYGNSGILMPKVVEKLRGPALFWLDGHYSGPSTACGGKQTPVEQELAAIYQHRRFPCIILIDDARLFNGTNDYPNLDQILKDARLNWGSKTEVSADVIRLIPSRMAKH